MTKTQELKHIYKLLRNLGIQRTAILKWMLTANHVFFDTTPMKMVLGGRGDAVIKTLEAFSRKVL